MTKNQQSLPVGERRVRWVAAERDDSSFVTEYRLIVGKLIRRGKMRCVATVWVKPECNYATWHTWDIQGTGGENSVEYADSCEAATLQAKGMASLAAITQGFV